MGDFADSKADGLLTLWRMTRAVYVLVMMLGLQAHAQFVDYGSPVTDALGHFEVDLYDASGNQRATSSNPLFFKSPQLAAALGSQTLANSTSVGIASDQFSSMSTSALQTSGNSSLSAIQAGIPASLGQKTMSASTAVAIASDQTGLPIVPLDGTKATYSVSFTNLTVPTVAAQDVVAITGSASKTVRILRIGVSGSQTTAGQRDVTLVKRSTANSGGTTTAGVAVAHDSNSAAATSTSVAYSGSTAPTYGTAVGTLRVARLFFATSTTDSDNWYWDFGTRPGQAIVLRGTSQVLGVSLNGVVAAGTTVDVSIEFTEE